MSEKFLSGYSRSNVFLLLTLAVTVACLLPAVAADCPSGCSCLLPADAQKQGLSYCGGQQSICSYDRSQNPMYCYGTKTVVLSAVTVNRVVVVAATTTAPVTCPDGYTCLSDAAAASAYGTYSKYSDAVCGYTKSTATAVAVVQVPEYCVKASTSSVSCPEGCTCMLESAAKEKFGTYTQCSDTPCTSVVTGAAAINAYCFRQGTPTTTVTTTQPVTCPDGCVCLSDADAKNRGLTARCSADESPCGYQTAAATANVQANRIPEYCYKLTTTTTTTTSQTCPQGCACMNEADAKAKYGAGNYARCSETACGYDQSAASANGIPRYCFKPVSTTTTATSCGATAACGGCTFDYTKNACSGTCPATGQACSLKTICYDVESGRTLKAECGCNATGSTTAPTAVPTASCAMDASGACSGTCPLGGQCAPVVKTDAATGAQSTACGCTGATSAVPATTTGQAPANNGDFVSFLRGLFGMK